MAEPLDPDREAGQAPSPESDDSDAILSEDDLDIDALVAVWKDDLLLDAIGSAPCGSDRLDVPIDVSADRELVDALLAWRRGVESDPIIPIGPERVRGASADSQDTSPHRPRFRVPLVSTLAAAVLLVFTALAAYGATPHEVLWPVTEVLYSQHAASVQAADDAQTAQAQAEAAIAAGHTQEAEAALHAAASRIPQVRSQDGQTQVQNRQHDLERQLKTSSSPASRTSKPGPGASRQSAEPSAAPKQTSRPTTRASRSDEPSAAAAAKAKKADASATKSGSATTTRDHPTSKPSSASSAPPPHRVQRDDPPPPSRDAGPSSARPTPGATRTDTSAAKDNPRRREPVEPTKRNPPPTTPQQKAKTTPEPDVGQTVEPSSTVRPTGNRRMQAPARQPDPPLPTSRLRATPPPADESR
jgi:hypothetical protein